jgi:hypothetical protein
MAAIKGLTVTIYHFVASRGPGDLSEHAEMIVSYDDQADPSLAHLVGTFVQFLKGLTFESESIKKFIDHEMV